MNGPPPFGCFDGEIDVWNESKGIGKHFMAVPGKRVKRREDHPTPSYLSMANIQHTKPHFRFMKAFRFFLKNLATGAILSKPHLYSVQGRKNILDCHLRKDDDSNEKMRSYWTTEAHNRHYIEGGKKLECTFR